MHLLTSARSVYIHRQVRPLSFPPARRITWPAIELPKVRHKGGLVGTRVELGVAQREDSCQAGDHPPNVSLPPS